MVPWCKDSGAGNSGAPKKSIFEKMKFLDLIKKKELYTDVAKICRKSESSTWAVV